MLLAAVLMPVLALGDGAQVLAVRTEVVEGRPALQILTFGEPVGVSVGREGDEVVVAVVATAPPLPPPQALAPIEAVGMVRQPERTIIRLRVPPNVPFQVQREGTLINVLFDETAAPQEPVPGDVTLLYSQLFPPPPPPPMVTERDLEADREGWWVGPFRVRPGISLSYSTGSTTVDSPDPVDEEYLLVQPHLGLETSLLDGRLTASYHPTLRGLSNFEQTSENSHTVNAALQLELGPSLHLRLADRYVWGVLETDEVDPGREYFFDLARFTRNYATAGLRFKGASRLDLDLSLHFNRVDFAEESSFYDHDRWGAKLGLGYELSPRVRSELAYVYDEVPTPTEHPEAYSYGHGLRLMLEGELAPLMDAEVFVGYQKRRAPNAGEGGQRIDGVVAGGQVRKELSPRSWIGLSGERSTYPSAFESNGIYVSNAIQGNYSLPTPFGTSLTLAGGYRLNEYGVVSPEIGEPREDTIWGWSVGLGRPVSRSIYIRVDYNWQKRNSNLNGFDTQTDGFLFQVGLRLQEG